MTALAHATVRTPTATPVRRRTQIVEHYPTVRGLAAKMKRRCPEHVELDELLHAGALGLIDAVDRYDPSLGVPLRRYVEIRARGAMLDAMRSADWAPRSVRARARRLERSRAHLRQRLGREPGGEEIAASMGLATSEYEAMRRDAEVLRLVSLEARLDGSGEARVADVVADGGDSPEDRWLDAERWRIVARAIDDLPERERVTVTLYYRQGRSLKEIGAALGVSESRACQLRGAAVRRLRRRLGARQNS